MCPLSTSDTCCGSNWTVWLLITFRLPSTCIYVTEPLWNTVRDTAVTPNSSWLSQGLFVSFWLRFGLVYVRQIGCLLLGPLVLSLLFVFFVALSCATAPLCLYKKSVCVCLVVWMLPYRLFSADDCTGHFPMRLSLDDKFTHPLSSSFFPTKSIVSPQFSLHICDGFAALSF